MDARFTRLEEKVTFVEKQLAELDGVVRELGDGMEQIARRLDRLAAAFERHRTDPQGGASGSEVSDDEQLRQERPPHW